MGEKLHEINFRDRVVLNYSLNKRMWRKFLSLKSLRIKLLIDKVSMRCIRYLDNFNFRKDVTPDDAFLTIREGIDHTIRLYDGMFD